jgi:repressor of nif and glnA expression
MTSPLRFVSHVIEDYAIQVTFDPKEGTGNVVYNLSLIKKEDLEFALSVMKDAYKTGVCVSGLVKLFDEKEKAGDYRVPEGNTAICTMCSLTFDGLLIRRGVPTNPIGGGAVEIEHRTPRRFTNMIRYEYTTIDPLQVLISQDITSITNVMRRGSGTILANLRECHREAEQRVAEILDELADSATFSGILDVGLPNTPVLDVNVSPEYFGVAAVGGTNPMAAIKESGRWVNTRAMKGLMDVSEMTEIRNF